MTRTHRFLFTIGLVLIGIGSYGLLTKSAWSDTASSIFTIFGVMMSFSQLFLKLPVSATVSGSSITAPPPPSSKGVTTASTLNVSRTYRGSGIALLLGGLCLGVQGFLSLSNPSGILLNLTLELIVGALILCGLPGLQAKQSSKSGWIGTVSVAIIVAAWLINMLMCIIYIANFNPGALIPSSITTLYNINFYFIIVGDILFGIAIIRAAVYPGWTGTAVIVVGIASLMVALMPPGNANISAVIGDLGTFILAAFYLQCGYVLLI